jgi:hypothetical protein
MADRKKVPALCRFTITDQSTAEDVYASMRHYAEIHCCRPPSLPTIASMAFRTYRMILEKQRGAPRASKIAAAASVQG